MFSKIMQRQESVALLCLVLLMGYFFYSTGQAWIANMPSLLRDVSWLGIVAIGQAIVIISGEFDLSVGSVYAFVSMSFVVLLGAHVGPVSAFVLAIVLAAAIGFVNGYLVWRFKLPSLLVTLGAMFFYRGLVEWITGGQTVSVSSDIQESSFLQLLGGKSFGLFDSIYICGALLVVFSSVMAKTQFGNHVYAVGGDINAASATGVPCGAVKIKTFMISAVLAGLAGIITASSLNSVATSTGTAMEFEAIAATVIGGVLLLGGAGTVWGAVLGVFTLLSLKSGLILDGVNIFAYQMLLGIVLVVLVALRSFLPGAVVRN